MPSKITQAIVQQKFEFIRDRIFEILVVEFDQQHILTYDDDLDVGIYLERTMPFDEVEIPAITVGYAEGDYSNKHQGSQDGLYTYHIDHFASAKSTLGIAGDTKSNLKLQKMMGVTRAILEDPIYKTLGVTPPFIMKSYVSKMGIAASKEPRDATNQSMGRVIFNVVANETSKLIIPTIIEDYKTHIKIDNTGKGYFYLGETYNI